MARLNSPWSEMLSQDDFEQYPVWTWDDGNEGYLPMANVELSWDEYGTYFIKATFKTHSYIFDGYLVGNETFYALGMFINNHEVGFSRNMPEFVDQTLAEIFELLKCKPFQFFPIQYVSQVRFKDWGVIEGTWEPKALNRK